MLDTVRCWDPPLPPGVTPSIGLRGAPCWRPSKPMDCDAMEPTKPWKRRTIEGTETNAQTSEFVMGSGDVQKCAPSVCSGRRIPKGNRANIFPTYASNGFRAYLCSEIGPQLSKVAKFWPNLATSRPKWAINFRNWVIWGQLGPRLGRG